MVILIGVLLLQGLLESVIVILDIKRQAVDILVHIRGHPGREEYPAGLSRFAFGVSLTFCGSLEIKALSKSPMSTLPL